MPDEHLRRHLNPRPWRVSAAFTEGDGQEHDIPDLVRRDFTADAPAEKMVGDMYAFRSCL